MSPQIHKCSWVADQQSLIFLISWLLKNEIFKWSCLKQFCIKMVKIWENQRLLASNSTKFRATCMKTSSLKLYWKTMCSTMRSLAIAISFFLLSTWLNFRLYEVPLISLTITKNEIKVLYYYCTNLTRCQMQS